MDMNMYIYIYGYRCEDVRLGSQLTREKAIGEGHDEMQQINATKWWH